MAELTATDLNKRIIEDELKDEDNDLDLDDIHRLEVQDEDEPVVPDEEMKMLGIKKLTTVMPSSLVGLCYERCLTTGRK